MTARGPAIVAALPRELGAGGTVAQAEISFDGDEHQLAAALSAERNMRSAKQVDLVRLVRLRDPPAPGKGAGEAPRGEAGYGSLGVQELSDNLVAQLLLATPQTRQILP